MSKEYKALYSLILLGFFFRWIEKLLHSAFVVMYIHSKQQSQTAFDENYTYCGRYTKSKAAAKTQPWTVKPTPASI